MEHIKAKEILNLIINKKEKKKIWKMSYLSPYYYSRYPYYRSYYPYSYLDYPYYPRSYYYDYPLTRSVDVVTTTTTTEVPVYTPSYYSSYYYPRSYYYPSYRYYSPYLERSYYTTYIWASLWWFRFLKSHLYWLS